MCPEPEGGWELPDPARRSERYLEPVDRLARAAPDFAGLWISYLAPMGDNVAKDPGEFVLNVAFTGDLGRLPGRAAAAVGWAAVRHPPAAELPPAAADPA